MPPAGEYGPARATEREEQGMCPPEGGIRLKAERDPRWNPEERTNLEKEKHL